VKRSLVAIIAGFVLSACATPTGTTQTPAQIAASVCPSIHATLDSLATLPWNPADTAKLNTAVVTVGTVCSLGATVTSTDLQTIANQALPAILSVIGTSTLSDEKKSQYTTDLIAANAILNAAISISGK
jgi:hypothetical protein